MEFKGDKEMALIKRTGLKACRIVHVDGRAGTNQEYGVLAGKAGGKREGYLQLVSAQGFELLIPDNQIVLIDTGYDLFSTYLPGVLRGAEGSEADFHKMIWIRKTGQYHTFEDSADLPVENFILEQGAHYGLVVAKENMISACIFEDIIRRTEDWVY